MVEIQYFRQLHPMAAVQEGFLTPQVLMAVQAAAVELTTPEELQQVVLVIRHQHHQDRETMAAQE
jgi:uncharacterized protein YqgV (UPF0045/DUF77 family)